MDFPAIALEFVKGLGTVASVAFGIYAIGSKTLRDDHGSLTKAGRVALIGLVISFLVSISAQLLEGIQRAESARAEARRYEQLLRGSLYSSLGTRETLLDLKFSVKLDDLRLVEPDYAKRLETAYKHRTSCEESRIPIGIQFVKTWDCDDYKIRDTGLTVAQLKFDKNSKLFPQEKSEAFAYSLLTNLGVGFSPSESENDKNNRDSSWRDAPPLFLFGKFLDGEQLTFEGDSLTLEIKNYRLNPDLLTNANFTSMIDVLGRELTIDPNLVILRCPGKRLPDAPQCKDLLRVLNGGARFDRFALKFPHRRDIIIDPNLHRRVITTEKKARRVVYVFPVPASIEELKPIDRLDWSHR